MLTLYNSPGPMYHQPWVQNLIRQIQEFLQANYEWLDIDQTSNQRVLDYACGNGTVSGVRYSSLRLSAWH